MCLMFSMCLPVTLVVMSELLLVRCEVPGLRFDFAGTRRLSAPGGHLVGPGDILPTGPWWGALQDAPPAWWRSPPGSQSSEHRPSPASPFRHSPVSASIRSRGRGRLPTASPP